MMKEGGRDPTNRSGGGTSTGRGGLVWAQAFPVCMWEDASAGGIVLVKVVEEDRCMRFQLFMKVGRVE
jgi:hypothetical protein